MEILTHHHVNDVRHFNRFITQYIGVLEEGLLQSSYSLTESRILFELANGNNMTISGLTTLLGLDAGYVSRIISKLEKMGILHKIQSESDGRQRYLRLSEKGMEEYKILNARSHDEVYSKLKEIHHDERERLVESMKEIERILSHSSNGSEKGEVMIRPHKPGDMGMIIHKNGYLYDKEYGWDEEFEALVAQITADFIRNFQPAIEKCWVAEMNGEVVGSVFVVKGSESIAKLRLLFVDPKARGFGLGTKLVQECIDFSRKAGYEKLVLWTNSNLVEARHIYKKTGFNLVSEEKHRSFGHELVGETWELNL